MKSKIVETDDHVFIENIPRLQWGRNMENTFIKSLQLTFNVLGEDVSYEYLMGISGAAFRFHFHPDWCPSSPDATVGFDTSKVTFDSLGYDYECITRYTNEKSNNKNIYQKIVSSINKKIPVIAIDLKECPDWGIITGYLKNKPGLLCRTYYDESEDYSLAQKVPWTFYFIRNKKDRKSEDEILIDSIKLAVSLAKTDEFERYKNGFAAFEYWIEALKDQTNFDTKKEYMGKMQPNAWIYRSLLDSRLAGKNYLIEVKDKIPLENLSLIIHNYDKIVQILRSTTRYVPFPWELKKDMGMDTGNEKQTDKQPEGSSGD